jgi:hypothetical protein
MIMYWGITRQVLCFMARRTFSITDIDVLKYLDAMESGVRSRYIVNLIKKDMEGSKIQYVTREELMEILESYSPAKENSINDDSFVEKSIIGVINL